MYNFTVSLSFRISILFLSLSSSSPLMTVSIVPLSLSFSPFSNSLNSVYFSSSATIVSSTFTSSLFMLVIVASSSSSSSSSFPGTILSEFEEKYNISSNISPFFLFSFSKCCCYSSVIVASSGSANNDNATIDEIDTEV